MSEKKDILDTNSKKRMFRIILFLCIIIASIIIFLASYYSSINKVYNSYETTLIDSIDSITQANKITSQFNSNETIDIDYAKEKLPDIIKDLSKLRDDLSALDPSSKYKDEYENLKLGLDKNLLIYRQALAILNNPSGNDVEVSMESLKTYRNDCMNFYSLIDSKDAVMSLPESSLDFIDNVLNYSSSAVMVRKETDIKSQQNQEFIYKIDDLSRELLSTKTNYYLSVLKVRKKEISYDEALSLVDANLLKLSDLQSKFKTLSIPSPAISTYEAFKALLNTQERYLLDFKLALTSEKIQALNAIVDLPTLDSLYTSSNARFAETENHYNDFIKVYTELKSKN